LGFWVSGCGVLVGGFCVLGVVCRVGGVGCGVWGVGCRMCLEGGAEREMSSTFSTTVPVVYSSELVFDLFYLFYKDFYLFWLTFTYFTTI